MIDAATALRRGAELLGRGDRTGARRVAEQALELHPHDAGLCQLLGALFCQDGDLERGVEWLERSLHHDPRRTTTRLNLARALTSLARHEEALAVCVDGSGPDIERMRGDILRAAGRAPEAVQAYRRAVTMRADFVEAWNNLGNALRDAGDPDAAVAALQRAVRLRPQLAVCQLNLGRALLVAKRFDEALAAFDHAARADPTSVEALFELGVTLAAMGRHEESLAPLQRAVALDPRHARAVARLALTLVALERLPEAEAAYERSLALDPRDPATYLYYGVLLEESNRVDDLRALLQRAESAGVPPRALPVVQARLLKREGRLDEALALLDPAANAEPLVQNQRAQLLGEIADRRGDVEAAFRHFGEMNRLRAAEPGSRVHERLRYVRHIERLRDHMSPEQVRAWSALELDTRRRAPVFLVGFPRSGTTLLDTMLLGHPDVFVLEESRLLPQVAEALGDPLAVAGLDAASAGALRARYFEGLDAIPETRDAPCVIDKSPLHLTLAGFIHRVFPDARFVFCVRHPCDVVLSCFMQNLWVNEVGASFLDIADTALLYDRIMDYWTRCRDCLPLRVHELHYERLVQDAQAGMRAVLDFLELDWHPGVLAHQRTAIERGRIGTPSYAQVAEGLYSRSIGRWQRYAGHLGPALPLLAPWVRRFGYPEPGAAVRSAAESAG